MIHVAIAVQKGQVGLTDDNVIGGGVVVQFLVPLLHEAPVHLLEMIAVHDMQDLITHLLTLTTATQGAQHQSHPGPAWGMLGIDISQAGGEPLLRVTQFTGLGVVVTLPVQLADR